MNVKKTQIILAVVFVLIGLSLFFVFSDKKTTVSSISINKTNNIPLAEQLLSIEIPNLGKETDDIVRLEKGKLEGTWNGEGYWSIYLDEDLKSRAIVDVTNDGLDDVIVIIGTSGGGSGYFYNLAVFKNNKGILEYMTSTVIGDRIKVNKITYESGLIVADIITQGPNEGYCCGTTPAVLKFKLDKDTLVPVQ